MRRVVYINRDGNQGENLAGGSGGAAWSDVVERYMRVKCTSSGRAFHVHIASMLQRFVQMNQHNEGVQI